MRWDTLGACSGQSPVQNALLPLPLSVGVGASVGPGLGCLPETMGTIHQC